jgi:hypothetical protein
MASAQDYIARIKKARETMVPCEGVEYDFVVRRPTDMEMLESKKFTRAELFQKFVVDWPGMKELHLVPGGTGIEVPFDAELFVEWVADRPELWGPLSEAIVESYQRHQKALDDKLGKPAAG